MTSSRSQTLAQVVSGRRRAPRCLLLAQSRGWLQKSSAMNHAPRKLTSGENWMIDDGDNKCDEDEAYDDDDDDWCNL